MDEQSEGQSSVGSFLCSSNMASRTATVSLRSISENDPIPYFLNSKSICRLFTYIPSAYNLGNTGLMIFGTIFVMTPRLFMEGELRIFLGHLSFMKLGDAGFGPCFDD